MQIVEGDKTKCVLATLIIPDLVTWTIFVSQKEFVGHIIEATSLVHHVENNNLYVYNISYHHDAYY